MKNILLTLLMLVGLSVYGGNQPVQQNRFTTNVDSATIDGGNLTNVSGPFRDPVIITNSLDPFGTGPSTVSITNGSIILSIPQYENVNTASIPGFGSIVWGYQNTNLVDGAVVVGLGNYNGGGQFLGGGNNIIDVNAQGATIVGGGDNSISNCLGAFIGAGDVNRMQGPSDQSALVAGEDNFMGAYTDGSFIGAGDYNVITNSAVSFEGHRGGFNIVLVGGSHNTVGSNDYCSGILGGQSNSIVANSPETFIIGSKCTNTEARQVVLGYSTNAATISSNGVFAVNSIAVSSNVVISTVGQGLKIKEGSGARMGTATLSSGSVIVNNASVTANTRFFLTPHGSTIAAVGISAVSANTSFTIKSSSGTDSNTVDWMLVEPSP